MFYRLAGAGQHSYVDVSLRIEEVRIAHIATFMDGRAMFVVPFRRPYPELGLCFE